MEKLAEVYSRSLFEVASEQGKIDVLREQLGQFADALGADRQLAIFFFSPYFSSQEKKDGLARALVDADPTFVNFLHLLIEKHRMPVIYRIRRAYDVLCDRDHKVLPVLIWTATELDPGVADTIGERIALGTGQQIQLTATVDPEILGGIVLRVGNSILDASIRNRLDTLRKHVARGAA